jgi:hypothetical protein
MNIRSLNPTERPAYDELARQHGTLFNRLDWLALFGDRMHLLGLFDDGGTLVGGLSLYQERRWGLPVLRRAPFTPTCGPFLAVKSQNPVAVLEERRKALDAMAAHLDALRPAVCMLPLDRGVSDALPFFWRGYKVIPQYTYLLDLAQPQDRICKNMSPDRRNDISKAVRDGLTVRPAGNFGEVRDLVLATFGRQEKYVDRECLEGILFQYASPSNSFAYVVCREGRPIATCFVIHDSKTAYYLLGGYRAADRHHGAGALAVWEAIRHAQDIGLHTFDFEGSVLPPIERFFRGFGGRLTPYFTINKAWGPLEIGLKFFRRGFF